MSRLDWQLPPGVTRSLWEFAHDPAIARDETRHLSDSPLLEFDQQVLRGWLPNPGTLLDLGCGTGRHLVALGGRGWRCTGVDLSQESLCVAKERAAGAGVAVTLIRGNLCDLNFLSPARFDAALLLFGTLGMVSGRENRQAVLRQVRQFLRPGGRLVLHVHNVWRHAATPQGRRWIMRDLWKRFRRDPTAGDSLYDYRGIPRMYHHSFTYAEIRQALAEADLQIAEMIPLGATPGGAPDPGGVPSLQFAGAFERYRATGWLMLVVA